MVFRMEMARHNIVMETSIKEILLMVKDKDLVHIHLIKFLNMKDNGETILSLEKENYLGIMSYFLKETSKTD